MYVMSTFPCEDRKATELVAHVKCPASITGIFQDQAEQGPEKPGLGTLLACFEQVMCMQTF